MQKKLLEAMPYKLPSIQRRTAKDQYIYTAALVPIRDKDHLVVEIYPVRKSVTEPIGRMVLTETEYAIYITKSGMKLLKNQSLHNENPCWKQSSMAMEVQWYAINQSVYDWRIDGKDVKPDEREDESVIKSCVEAWGLKQRNIGILSILAYKDKIKRRKEQQRYQKRIDAINEKQREVGEISAGFRSWALKIAGQQVLFYKTKTRKTAEVICSHCGKRYTVDRNAKPPVHGTEGKCKECKTTGVYISVGMNKRVVYDKETGLLQRGKINKKELVYRQFTVRKVCVVRVGAAGEILTAKTDIQFYEKYRSFLAAEGLKEHYNHSYGFESYNNWWDTNGYGYNALTIGEAALYPCSLNNTVKGTVLENSGINIMANRGAPFAITRYIDLYGYQSCKVLESIVKVGLYKLTNELLDDYYAKRHIDVTQISIRKALDIDRAGLRNLIRMDGGIKELRIIRRFGNLSDNMVRQAVAACSNVEQIIAVSEYVGLKKAVAYLDKQKRLLSAYDCADLYEDYLRFAERLHYDLKDDFVLFPNNVRRAHDEAMALIRSESTKQKQDRYDQYILAYKNKYEIADNKTKLQIIVPEQLQDIATEGKILHHCVGTYIEKVANKQTVIVFIRRMEEPEKPYYTMEIKNDEIIQVRGARNCNPTADVSEIVRKLKAKIEKRVKLATRETGYADAEVMAPAM